MSRHATLKTVAELSGVSVSTVSRILNNRKQGFSVRLETRQRVLDAAERLNYRPDPIVRTIRAKQTNLISILGLQDFGSTIHGTTEDAMNVFAEKMYEAGFELCTNVMGPRTPLFSLPRWRVDGAVVLDCPDPAVLEEIDEAEVPYITINSLSGRLGSSVTVDDEGAACEAVQHLMALGHKRVAYVVADEYGIPHQVQIDPIHHESVRNRHKGYVKALTQRGLTPLTPEVPPRLEPIEAMRRAVVEGGATGLLVYHHLMAVRMLRAAAVLGLRVPQDVSIVCFNDIFPCADIMPALTTVALPGERMGETAADLLTEQIRGEVKEPQHRVFPARLIIRDSSGPAPQTA